MVKMIEHIFMTGPRNCGKSILIEKKMACFAQKLYIGTLWNKKSFKSIIDEHSKRRDNTWALHEISGNCGWDLKQIDKKLKEMEYPNSCLVDGLTTWAENISGYRKDQLLNAACCVTGTIEYLVNNNPDTKWYFVDIYPDILTAEKRYMESKVCEIIHSNLMVSIKPMKLLKWRRRS